MLAERLLHDGLHWPSFSAAQAEESARWVFARVRQGWCAMRGHDLMLHLEPCRLSLRCADCGWESPGWTIERSRAVHRRHRQRTDGNVCFNIEVVKPD